MCQQAKEEAPQSLEQHCLKSDEDARLEREEVAQLMVEGFGGVLTQLTQTQADYIGVEQQGPFKPESYKY